MAPNSDGHDAGNHQSELDEYSPSWAKSRLEDDTTPPEWSDLHEYDPKIPFAAPKWSRHNGWKKWHAARDCGRETVYIMEDPMADANTDEDRAWTLYCARCGGIRWDEVLFVNRDWYYDLPERSADAGWKFLKAFDSIWLDPDMVCNVGGVPSSDEVENLIRRSYYEQEAKKRMAPQMPWEVDNGAE